MVAVVVIVIIIIGDRTEVWAVSGLRTIHSFM